MTVMQRNCALCVLLAVGAAASPRCNYNGKLDPSGLCRCDKGWKGPTCAQLALVRTSRRLGLNSLGNTTSWGGSVVRADDGRYHMYAAEMSNGCGMNTWLSNSAVVHATSPDPQTTPFTRVGTVTPYWAHEPIAARAPTGEYVLWYTAVLPPLPPPVVPMPDGQRVCSGCAAGRSKPGCGIDVSRRNRTQPLPTYMAWADSPGGPWSAPAMIPGTAVFADSNFAAVILPNSSLVGLTRHSAVFAAHWKDVSSYQVLSPFDDAGEDPFVWTTMLSTDEPVYHAIVHVKRSHTTGLHYYSTNGRDWVGADGPAYNWTIGFTDGSELVLACRERPHIVQDGQGQIIGLTNGAAPVTCDDPAKDDWAFTSFQIVE